MDPHVLLPRGPALPLLLADLLLAFHEPFSGLADLVPLGISRRRTRRRAVAIGLGTRRRFARWLGPRLGRRNRLWLQHCRLWSRCWDRCWYRRLGLRHCRLGLSCWRVNNRHNWSRQATTSIGIVHGHRIDAIVQRGRSGAGASRHGLVAAPEVALEAVGALRV